MTGGTTVDASRRDVPEHCLHYLENNFNNIDCHELLPVTADDTAEMIACGKYSLAHFGPHSENCASLLEGYMSDYEPQGKQRYCQTSEVTPEVVTDMRATIKETCIEKLEHDKL